MKQSDDQEHSVFRSDEQAHLRFRKALIHWHLNENLRSLPWKGENNPYKIWLSEIMLQQTRAEQGLPYYLKFISAYPTVEDLAAAKDDDAFRLWQGLGYYARCRNMLATARQITSEHKGIFPNTYAGLLGLRGIGPYTAAAIASFAFGLPHAVVDGNVYRVLARYFGIVSPTDGTEGKKIFQQLADAVLDETDPGSFNQAMMDLGATICTPALPKCGDCPLSTECVALRSGLTGSLPIRGKKAPVRNRYFNYLLLHYNNKVWLQLRSEKDIWKGLYEPFMIETESEADSRLIQIHPAFQKIQLFTAPAYEGQLSQKLTHQLIHSKFFSVVAEKAPDLPAAGRWVSYTELKDCPFPKTLVNFFEKKGYF